MIKTLVLETKLDKQPSRRYPYIGVSTRTFNRVHVLFTSVNTGFVVATEDEKMWKVGDYCGAGAGPQAWDEDSFAVMPSCDSITLRNSEEE